MLITMSSEALGLLVQLLTLPEIVTGVPAHSGPTWSSDSVTHGLALHSTRTVCGSVVMAGGQSLPAVAVTTKSSPPLAHVRLPAGNDQVCAPGLCGPRSCCTPLMVTMMSSSPVGLLVQLLTEPEIVTGVPSQNGPAGLT